MNEIFAKTRQIVTDPREFYKKLNETDFKPALMYLAFWSLIRLLLAFVVSIFAKSNSAVSFSVLAYFFELILSFVGAAFLHLWIKIFKGKANYAKTYQLYVYSNTPNLLLGWFPIVSIIAKIYGLIILIVGTQELHKISERKSILMYVVPTLLFVLLVVLALVGVIAVLSPLIRQGLIQNIV